ncbi:MAG: hypothetical protein QXV16_00655 [Candidatus Anstonellales archaeon]
MRSNITINYGIDPVRFRNQPLEAQVELSIINPRLFPLLLDTLPDRSDFIKLYQNIRDQLTREHYRYLLSTYKENIPNQLVLDYQRRDDLDIYDRMLIDLYISALKNPYLRALISKLDQMSL